VQRRVARTRGLRTPLTGAVTFVQRFGGLVNLNVHFHLVVPDGVFAEDGAGLRFEMLPVPTNAQRAGDPRPDHAPDRTPAGEGRSTPRARRGRGARPARADPGRSGEHVEISGECEREQTRACYGARLLMGFEAA